MASSKNKITEKEEEKLREARHAVGLYSSKEICAMFGISRYSLDYPLNTGRLRYVSPNNQARFIYLKDYLDYLDKKGSDTNSLAINKKPLPQARTALVTVAKSTKLNAPILYQNSLKKSS